MAETLQSLSKKVDALRAQRPMRGPPGPRGPRGAQGQTGAAGSGGTALPFGGAAGAFWHEGAGSTVVRLAPPADGDTYVLTIEDGVPAWVLSSSLGNVVDTLQQTYDVGAATITKAAAKPVAITDAQTDGSHAFTIEKSPGSAAGGNAFDVTMGTNATGYGVRVEHAGLSASELIDLPFDIRLGTVQDRGILLKNPTLATDGTRLQNSPPIVLEANAYGTVSDVNFALKAAIQLSALVDGSGSSVWDPLSRLDFWLAPPGGSLERIVALCTDGAGFLNGWVFPEGNGLSWWEADDPGNAIGSVTVQGGELVLGGGGEVRLGGGALYPGSTETLGRTTDRWSYLYGGRVDLEATERAILVTGTTIEHANAATDTEDVLLDLARDISYVGSFNDPEGGSATVISEHVAFRITAPTFVAPDTPGWGYRVAKAATVAIEGAPADGGGSQVALNADDTYSLWVQSGLTQLDGALTVAGATTLAGLSATSGAFTGIVTNTSQFRASGSSFSAPGFVVMDAEGDGDTGIYSPGTNQLGFAVGSTGALIIDSDASIRVQGAGSVGTPILRLGNDASSGLYRPASNQIAIALSGVRRALFADSGIVFDRQAYTTPVALTDGATVNHTPSQSNNFTWSNGQSSTLANPSGTVAAGMEWSVDYTPTGVGPWTITWGSNYKGEDGGSPPQPDTTIGRTTVFSFRALSATRIAVVAAKGFAA